MVIAIETILVHRDGDGVVEITLNRPERLNAFNQLMLSELGATVDEVTERTDDRVLVLGGAGGAFCSGLDLASGDSAGPQPHRLLRMRKLSNLILALHRMPKPTIAKVDGVAAGAGCNIALACDLVVASDRARFSEIFIRRGLTVDGGGSWLLPRLVGLHKAKELVLLGDFVSGADAERIGLINRVVPVDDLDEAVGDWAKKLSAGPPLALQISKALLNTSFSVSMDEALDAEASGQSVCFATEDAREALDAFKEKRPPKFAGH